LGWITKFDKGDFIGRAALAAQREKGVARKLVGFFLEDAGIARQGDSIALPDTTTQIGVVTSGTKTPTVQRALGMAFVAAENSAVDSPVSVVVRGREIRATIVALPFYKRKK
jgi:aminomethyltransferase